MRYIKLGRSGLDVSPIAIGAMTYGEPGRAMLETCGSAGKGERKGCTFPVSES